MNTKSTSLSLKQGSIEIFFSPFCTYFNDPYTRKIIKISKPYLLRVIRSDHEKLELRLNEEELKGLTDLFNSYLEGE